MTDEAAYPGLGGVLAWSPEGIAVATWDCKAA